MKIAQLKTSARDKPEPLSSMRGTHAQDVALTVRPRAWRKHRWLYASAAGTVLLIGLFVWLIHGWTQSKYTISAERLRIAEVTRGRFVRDVAAEGTVVAPVSPTLFAIGPGTVSYLVHAGDAVQKGQVLAVVDSPELKSEYLRERATLDSLNAGIAHQEIEIRQQLLTSQQQADLAQVQINAAQREYTRLRTAWKEGVWPERDFAKAADDLADAKLGYQHARASAQLNRESVVLDLRTRRLERDRQALVVEDFKRRVDELSVRSPVNGMVGNLAQQDKADVAENAPLITVVDLTALEIEFRVAESYATDIRPGMGAEITLGGVTDRGVVTAMSPQVQDNEVVGRVKFAHGQPAGLRQNQRASVRIVLNDQNDVLEFERGPLIDDATRTVYLVKGNRAIRVPVELGPVSVSDVQVDRGLQSGDRVIISDTRDFNDAPQLLIGR